MEVELHPLARPSEAKVLVRAVNPKVCQRLDLEPMMLAKGCCSATQACQARAGQGALLSPERVASSTLVWIDS